MWTASGRWDNHGTFKHSSVLARIDLEAPWEAGNVEVITKGEASRKAIKHVRNGGHQGTYVRTKTGRTQEWHDQLSARVKTQWTPERRQAQSERVKGRLAALTPEQRQALNTRISEGMQRRRWIQD